MVCVKTSETLMAAESRVEYFLPAHCGEARGCMRNSEMAFQSYSPPPPQMPPLSDPQLQFYPRDDKRHLADMRAQYHSWQAPHYPVPAQPFYPSSEVNGAAPMYGAMPQMRVQGPSMVPPTVQPSFAAMGQQPTPRSRARIDFGTDSSSSNCTPRDHYGGVDRTQQKRSFRKNGSPRFPVVRIPDTLKKPGQPSPAPYLNSRGFPLRVGKQDCKHYTTKGWCAYGTLCKFNHPESISVPPRGPCPAMAPYGPHPHGMNSCPWVGMPPYPQWGPWSQQQMYSMPQGPCYLPYGGYACTASSPTASVHSSRENSMGSDGEKTRDPEALVVYN